MSEPDIGIEMLGGNCPVQAEGTINGKPFYFRARGESWSIGIGGDPVVSPEWEHAEWYGQWPDAGWMPRNEAEKFIYKAAKRYHDGLPGGSLSDDPERVSAAQAKWEALLKRE